MAKVCEEIGFLLTRYEPGNDLHRAMFGAFGKVFGDKLAQNPVENARSHPAPMPPMPPARAALEEAAADTERDET